MSLYRDAAPKRRKPRGGHKNLDMLLEEYAFGYQAYRDANRRGAWDEPDEDELARRDPKRERIRVRVPQDEQWS